MDPQFEHLRRCASLSALQTDVHAMCAPFDAVVQLNVLRGVQVGRQRAQEIFHLGSFGDP